VSNIQECLNRGSSPLISADIRIRGKFVRRSINKFPESLFSSQNASTSIGSPAYACHVRPITDNCISNFVRIRTRECPNRKILLRIDRREFSALKHDEASTLTRVPRSPRFAFSFKIRRDSSAFFALYLAISKLLLHAFPYALEIYI